jgi:hypothetical protein
MKFSRSSEVERRGIVWNEIITEGGIHNLLTQLE